MIEWLTQPESLLRWQWMVVSLIASISAIYVHRWWERKPKEHWPRRELVALHDRLLLQLESLMKNGDGVSLDYEDQGRSVKFRQARAEIWKELMDIEKLLEKR